VIIINGANDCDDRLSYSTEFNTLNINITRVFGFGLVQNALVCL